MFLLFLNDEKISALTLANYVLERAQGQNIVVTNMKLQKILYYVQGYFLATFNRPLFPDKIQAWKFGPVVPNVYFEFSPYGSEALRKTEDADMSNCNEEERQLIDRVVDEKLQLDSRVLASATQQEEPWTRVTQNGTCIQRNAAIPTTLIKEYFRNFAT